MNFALINWLAVIVAGLSAFASAASGMPGLFSETPGWQTANLPKMRSNRVTKVKYLASPLFFSTNGC